MNTLVQVPPSVDAIYHRSMQLRVNAANVHAMFAQEVTFDSNQGSRVIRFRRYLNLTPKTTPLVQGQNPVGDILQSVDITTEVLDYGNYVPVASTVEYTTVNSELTYFSDILADNAAETVDLLTRNVLATGSQVEYGGNATDRSNVDATDLIDIASLRETKLKLKRANAKKLIPRMTTNNDVDTLNLLDSYWGIAHVNTVETLRGLTGWVDVQNYPHTRTPMPYEVGYIQEIRFVETTNAIVWNGAGASGINVYGTLVLAKDAYGSVRINGQSLKSIIKPSDSGGVSNPLNQFGTMAWKVSYAAIRLNESFMGRIEHAVQYE